MSAAHERPIYVAVLGADALLASRPHDPLQLTRACQTAGFELVVPVSWGEEVLATQMADRLTHQNGVTAFVAAVCPRVDARLTATPSRTPALRTVAPPIATTRYLRAAFHPRDVHVTYVGACPGADDPEIDVHCLPETLFARLVDSGIDIARQPRHLDGRLPVERSRYASAPGGVPDARWLRTYVGARIIEAAPVTADVVSQVYRDEALLIDLGAACNCVCARDRVALSRLEPPRSVSAVLPELGVRVFRDAETPATQPEPTVVVPASDNGDRRARFAENGLAGEAIQQPPGPSTLSRVMEPWS